MDTEQGGLIVDGNDHMSAMLQRFLNHQQLRTHSTETIADAQRLIQQQAFDTVLTDLFWPQKDGLNLVRFARESIPDIRVVVMAPFPSPALQARAHADGAYACLAKPFSLELLWTLVQQAPRR